MLGLGPEVQGWTIITIGVVALAVPLILFFAGVKDEKKNMAANKDQH